MKFKTSTLALSATLAAGLASSAFADTTPTAYEKLVFTTNQTYKASVENSTAKAENGAWNTTVEVDGTKGVIVIDSDSTEPLTFTPNVINAGAQDSVCDATELDFNVEASYVPVTVDLATNTAARCGFAIKLEGTTPKYWLFDGTGWAQQSTAVSVNSGEMFELKVRLDGREGVKTATYFVGATQIGTTPLGAKTADVTAIDFVGTGLLSKLNGYNLQLVSEKIEITPAGGSEVTLVIPEQQIAAIKTKAGSTPIATYLNQEVNVAEQGKEAVKITRLDAQVLFGKTDADSTDAAKVKVKGTPAAASSNEKVRVNVVGLTNVKVGGATITYQLEGSSDGVDFAPDDVNCPAVTNVENLEFPKNTKWRYIRVKTSVSYGNAQ